MPPQKYQETRLGMNKRQKNQRVAPVFCTKRVQQHRRILA